MSEGQKDRYIKRSIRSSSEGVILLPSKRAESVFELPRLNEIAQNMRRPMAACFLRRAVETMALTDDPERPYDGVPEGQLKIRARINPAGEVVRAEVLESGFADAEMEPCLTDVVRMQRWPQNKSGNAHYIDIVYWVSLGLQGDIHTDASREHLRREQVTAGIKGKQCLQGRVDAGTYEVRGLSLVNHEGATMATRVDHAALPGPIRACIARAFRSIRLPRDPDSFVRPVAPVVRFTVDKLGTVTVQDEAWLAMVELEERAQAAKRRADLRTTGKSHPTDELPPSRAAPLAAGAMGGAAQASAGDDDGAQQAPDAGPDVEAPPVRPAAKDPGEGGLKLDLGGRGSRSN